MIRRFFTYLEYISLLFTKLEYGGLRLKDWDRLDSVHQELFGKPYLILEQKDE